MQFAQRVVRNTNFIVSDVYLIQIAAAMFCCSDVDALFTFHI